MIFSVAVAAQPNDITITGDWSSVDEDALVDKLVDDAILTRPMAEQFVAALKQYNAQAQQQALTFQQCSARSENPSWTKCYNEAYGIDPATPSQYYFPGAVSKHALDNLWFLNPEDLQEFQDLGTAFAAKLQ